jgi:exosome complex component MTR3
VVIADRWPKSGVDVVVTVLEGEESGSADITANGASDGEPWGLMNVLSGCITVASAAVADAGIDSVDLVVGGAAAIVSDDSSLDSKSSGGGTSMVSDPYFSDHSRIYGACVVGYLPARDEITELWALGDFSGQQKSQRSADMERFEMLIEQAVRTAKCSRLVSGEALKESAQLKLRLNDGQVKAP